MDRSGSPGASASSSGLLTYTAVSIAHLIGSSPVMWDDTSDGEIYQIGGFQGMCIFISSDQQDEWGGSLVSLGWIDRGLPAGFGYPDQLALYCQYGVDAVTGIELPAFVSSGIHHGLCTL